MYTVLHNDSIVKQVGDRAVCRQKVSTIAHSLNSSHLHSRRVQTRRTDDRAIQPPAELTHCYSCSIPIRFHIGCSSGRAGTAQHFSGQPLRRSHSLMRL
ncbi:MAG TPA: hypothetical protein V6C50_03725 [Crinalium sp.]